jgi:hypothetical protein
VEIKMTGSNYNDGGPHLYRVNEKQFLRGCGIKKTLILFMHDGGASVTQENHWGNEEVFLSRDDILMLHALVRTRERAGVFEGFSLPPVDSSHAEGGS